MEQKMTQGWDSQTQVRTDRGVMTLEKLFKTCDYRWCGDSCEFNSYQSGSAKIHQLPVWRLSTHTGYQDRPIYIRRHRSRMARWEIVTTDGQRAVVTEDQTIAIWDKEMILNLKPQHLDQEQDLVTPTGFTKIQRVQELGRYRGDWVYTVGMHPGHELVFLGDILTTCEA